MRIGVIIALIVGLAISATLVAYHSLTAVSEAVWRIGWGLGIIVALHFVAMVFCGVAWWVLFASDLAVRSTLLIALRWIRESINTLLPVARVGGDIAGARLLALHGTKVNLSTASIVADRTVEVFSQFFFSVAGVVLLMQQGVNRDLIHWAVLGMIVLFPVLIAFLLGQRLGLLRVAEQVVLKLVRRRGMVPDSGNVGIHDALWKIYNNRRRLATAMFFHTLGWVLGVAQIWLALKFMGHGIGWANAFIIESLSQVVCTAAFIMPAALGAQEAGYMVVGELFGIPPELGLALSLVKRLGDVIIGIPGLLLWQGLEGQRLWALWKGRRGQAKST